MRPHFTRASPFRFFFFSREESRIHVHVLGPDGEAKFWVEPAVELAFNSGFSDRELARLGNLVANHKKEILNAWHRHFPG